jgi:hypothetical protein
VADCYSAKVPLEAKELSLERVSMAARNVEVTLKYDGQIYSTIVTPSSAVEVFKWFSRNVVFSHSVHSTFSRAKAARKETKYID